MLSLQHQFIIYSLKSKDYEENFDDCCLYGGYVECKCSAQSRFHFDYPVGRFHLG